MKKLLVASTALGLVAGAAVAEVKVTADGRMGVIHDSYKFNGDKVEAFGDGRTTGGWDFESRFRVTFTASGETDGGLSFGGTIRADNSTAGANGSGGNVWISGAFGRLSMGDVDSAAEAAVGQVLRGYPGFRNDEWDHVSYVGAGASTTNPVALYQYSFGDTTLFASLADGQDGGVNNSIVSNDILGFAPENFQASALAGFLALGMVNYGSATSWGLGSRAQSESYGIGVRHVFGDYTIAAGYESSSTTVRDLSPATGFGYGTKVTRDQLSIGATATFGDLYVKATYHDGEVRMKGVDGKIDSRQFALGVEYDIDALRLQGFYRLSENKAEDLKMKTEAYGVGASYDLGGGASVAGGIAKWRTGGEIGSFDLPKAEQTRAQIGLNFTF